MEFFRNVNIDWLGKKWYFLGFSLIFSVAGIISMAVHWAHIGSPVPLSVDFRGGTQLQDRFVRMTHRPMTELDMQAWTACRMIGEAASRGASTDPAGIMREMKRAEFGIAAYKGQQLSLRDWDWQLRQPIFLSDGRTIVSVSPQPGFLHQVTELDTLGFDRPETKCQLR